MPGRMFLEREEHLSANHGDFDSLREIRERDQGRGD